ncbi:phosphatidylinositol-glycan biosynthesis class X protein isoform X1 [Brienomyrus brachyistius]|uniref:phosphatidylinositol-glycan biosynthesis class X protein isoform X1 n=1 Tax=Brienomyrus brachyistius TaxID=42636 RepID=UPI0020B248C9|nr:phosphatidylinositol-glycan biosynthesis class X protein isoform X1 [Brienomyrus brachyistius]
MKVAFYCVLYLTYEIVEANISGEDNCGFSEAWLEQLTIRREIQKSGFHRELVTEVLCSTEISSDLRVLLVQRLPSGVYIDRYQLVSQRSEAALQVLLDTELDLEAPAYSSADFTTFLFPSWDLDGGGVLRLLAMVQIHARYQRPSSSGERWQRVDIEAPRLLLRADSCKQPPLLPPYRLVESPCTAHNLSMCTWLEVPPRQVQKTLSLHVPVGDHSLVVPVCTGTLLATLLCFGAVASAVCKHGLRR